ncbi:MAG TPA: COR domain-containing protein, partial [Chitinophagales bacterium]|nr:COR domain-containing protein [Chitinophagales bacterium]
IYYSLHRFFLTNNAVYIVMARSRDNDHKFDYWLPNIRLFAGEDNPIVAVYNLFKGFQNSAFSIDEYKKGFNLSPRLFSINLSKINDDSALRDLVTELHHRISQLPHINKPIWDNWLEVRNHLNSLVEKGVFEISHDKFADICRQYDVKEAEITDLGRYLHNLGVLLWYHDKPLLKNMVVLQPTWVTKAIYRLIDDKRIAKNNGHFSPSDTDRLWKGEEYANRKDELLLLAVQFKLCYEQRDAPNHYIIPARLSANMPPIAEAWNDKEGIYIEYRYEFMPHGLVNQLTAVQHKHLDNDSHAWSKGVVLHHLRTVAKVCVKEDTIRRTISVSVAPSKGATSLMAIIMDSMDDLHRDFQGIAVSIVIPCSCAKCKGMDYRKATVFDYDKLRQWYKEDSRKQVTCNESNTT